MTQGDILLCVAFAAYFSVSRTLADNRDSGKRGKALFWLFFVNCATAVAGGLITVPLSEIMHLERSWSLVLASVIGWQGLGSTMGLIESMTNWRFQAYGKHHHISGSSGNRHGPGRPGPVQKDSEPLD